MNRSKLTAALKSNLDGTRTLAQLLMDTEPPILDYNAAMDIPVRYGDISQRVAQAWQSSQASDYVSDALGEMEADWQKFTDRVWAALLAD